MCEQWIQVIALFLANAGLIVWFRAESRQDWRLMDSKMESFRAENGQIIRSMENTIKAIQQEMKDFHARLYSIEERNQEKNR